MTDKEQSAVTSRPFAYDEIWAYIQTSLCVWEYVLECMRTLSVNLDGNDCTEFTFFAGNEGTVQARENVAGFSMCVSASYDVSNGNDRYTDPFDWGFIPAVVDQCVRDHKQSTDLTGELIMEIVEQVISQHEANH